MTLSINHGPISNLRSRRSSQIFPRRSKRRLKKVVYLVCVDCVFIWTRDNGRNGKQLGKSEGIGIRSRVGFATEKKGF
ncbi:hypothetical protein SODALDRAFT_326212 [Sodiomyces alkalinus F11]|uniref:Uncharacterized protein n=1 Tax=Sodiomyces alkalinus (strain CBS 110278 / VKM F-3762 / F11) TaxID=1314773 RepID=A0A3N2Q5R8_SODAK|nr:hypothetical protein SODALDRAFT_326212 [Sodiomyces alkalinus F11]ROT42046.1 hypothetical protein SODALDRAFT_326212 [Sodiomyces alkalinus F11]